MPLLGVGVVLEAPPAVGRGPGAGEDGEFGGGGRRIIITCIVPAIFLWWWWRQDEVVGPLVDEDVDVVLLAGLLDEGGAFLGDGAEGTRSGRGEAAFLGANLLCVEKEGEGRIVSISGTTRYETSK